MVLLIVLCLVAFSPSTSVSFSLANIFGDGMVLQAAPYRSQVWGKLIGSTTEVRLTLECPTISGFYIAEQSKDEWLVTLAEIPGGNICTIEVVKDGHVSLFLQNVHFGDVWVCSGQSNMERPMKKIFNATEEIADIANYENIRLIHLPRTSSDLPLADVITNGTKKWFGTDDSEGVSYFSAVCLLYAKEISKKIGGSKVFGLIESSYGSTYIESWSTPEGLFKCQVPVNENNSHLFNSMIHPLLKFTIKGVLWYQGEFNGYWNTNQYSCTFPTLVSEWRRLWSTKSKTLAQFPFGFVQIASFRPNISDPAFPLIRWKQTANFGYVPNSELPNVFMAVSLDTFDAESLLHPRNKQLVAKRLATAGLNIAYGFSDEPINGPIPTSVLFTSNHGLTTVEIVYDQDFVYDLKESNGFYICCEDSYDLCDTSSTWEPVSNDLQYRPDLRTLVVPIKACAKGFAYLWNESPVLGTEALPIYSTNEAHLPAAPWIKPVIFGRT